MKLQGEGLAQKSVRDSQLMDSCLGYAYGTDIGDELSVRMLRFMQRHEPLRALWLREFMGGTVLGPMEWSGWLKGQSREFAKMENKCKETTTETQTKNKQTKHAVKESEVASDTQRS